MMGMFIMFALLIIIVILAGAVFIVAFGHIELPEDNSMVLNSLWVSLASAVCLGVGAAVIGVGRLAAWISRRRGSGHVTDRTGLKELNHWDADMSWSERQSERWHDTWCETGMALIIIGALSLSIPLAVLAILLGALYLTLFFVPVLAGIALMFAGMAGIEAGDMAARGSGRKRRPAETGHERNRTVGTRT